MSEWQPIETAPKNASEIILGDEGCSYSGFWCAAKNYWGEIGWYEESNRGGSYSAHPLQPTHWQPLPKPPNKAGVSQP